MKKHATKMGRNTAFHAEAERVRLLNQQAATVEEIYYADSMIKELQRVARNTRSKRRERFDVLFARRSQQIRHRINLAVRIGLDRLDDVERIRVWNDMLIRDDSRAYGADRTNAVSAANIHDWIWWTKLSEHERFDVVELSRPVKSERNKLKNIFKL